MATITVKHQSGKSNETSQTVTANAAGGTDTVGVLGPKQPDCPFTPGAGRYIKEASGVYRFVQHVRLAAGTAETTTYTSDAL